MVVSFFAFNMGINFKTFCFRNLSASLHTHACLPGSNSVLVVSELFIYCSHVRVVVSIIHISFITRLGIFSYTLLVGVLRTITLLYARCLLFLGAVRNI